MSAMAFLVIALMRSTKALVQSRSKSLALLHMPLMIVFPRVVFPTLAPKEVWQRHQRSIGIMPRCRSRVLLVLKLSTQPWNWHRNLFRCVSTWRSSDVCVPNGLPHMVQVRTGTRLSRYAGGCDSDEGH